MGKSGTTKYPKMFNLGSPFKLDPNKRMDKLSAKHKELYDRFEMGQTSESEEQKMYKLEDKLRLNDSFGAVMFEGLVSEVGEDFIRVSRGGKNEPKLTQCFKPSEYQGTIERL